MHNTSKLRAALGTAILGLCSLAARADDLPITLINDNNDDVIVSVRDLSTNPPSDLFTNKRINGFASIPITISSGDDGTGHLAWTAHSADPSNPHCGRKDRPGIQSGTEVHVYAKSGCPAPE